MATPFGVSASDFEVYRQALEGHNSRPMEETIRRLCRPECVRAILAAQVIAEREAEVLRAKLRGEERDEIDRLLDGTPLAHSVSNEEQCQAMLDVLGGKESPLFDALLSEQRTAKL